MHVLFVKSGCHWGIIVARLLNGRKREGFVIFCAEFKIKAETVSKCIFFLKSIKIGANVV